MSELRLAVMREDIPSSSPISCGIASIDDRIKDAYSKTICKQGLAYNIYAHRLYPASGGTVPA